MKKIFLPAVPILVFLFLLTVIACNPAQPQPEKTDFAKGADISWLPQMEASGYVSYNFV